MSKFFLGRDLMPDPSSQDNFDDISGWIEACSKHPNCVSPSDISLPLRVLDVGSLGSNESRLVITRGQTGIYICLSYCWGLSPGLTTTYDSLSSHLSGIPDAELPATLRDAVHITRKLDFRYLWIDALCILQRRPELINDEEALADWQDQSSKMADIYGNAFLTIVAAEASHKNQGCFIPRVTDSLICRLSVDENHPFEVSTRQYTRSRHSEQRTPIETRAWTFQEMTLSKRSLIYGNEISYQCKTCTFWEKRQSPSAVPEPNTMWVVNSKSILFSPPVKTKTTFIHGNKDSGPLSEWKPIETQATVRDHIILQWYLSLESNFCGRALTNEMDILPALSGVARRVKSIIGGAYYAGIWETDLPRGLLWKPRNALPAGKGKWFERPASYRAPSWSWATVKGQIYYGFSSRLLTRWENEKGEFPCEVLEVKTVLVGPIYDAMGQVYGGWIKIRAPVRLALLVSADVNTFRNEWKDSKGILHRFKMKGNENLLVGVEVLDRSDPKAVGAIGHFDTAEPWPVDFWCVLLTLREGLMLVRDREGSEEFKRIGIFKLQRDDWFAEYRSKCLTIV
jgi:hypothetical protein